jgi:hypothetical protein
MSTVPQLILHSNGEARMNALQSLLTIVLTSALSGGLLVTVESGTAIGKSRHYISGEGSHGSKSPDGVQKSAGASAAPATNKPGTGDTNEKSNVGAGDKGGRNSSGPTSDGPLGKGDDLHGKVAPQNAGTADFGKNQVGDPRDSSHRDAMHPGNNSGIEAVKSDNVIADGPGHKTKKTSDTTKKITTIFRPHSIKDEQHPSGPGKIEQNAIGAAIPNAGSPKSGLDSKPGPKVDVAATGAPSTTGIKAVANAFAPAVGHLGIHAVEGPPKNGPIINGTSVVRPGNLASVGGPGTLNGSSFKPGHP